MKYNKAMNGLWIPLVLIGGLMAALVYALFRKTDVVGTAEHTRASQQIDR
jgi:uncharacterized protein involved in exopolysaccharide biosynthesis